MMRVTSAVKTRVDEDNRVVRPALSRKKPGFTREDPRAMKRFTNGGGSAPWPCSHDGSFSPGYLVVEDQR